MVFMFYVCFYHLRLLIIRTLAVLDRSHSGSSLEVVIVILVLVHHRPCHSLLLFSSMMIILVHTHTQYVLHCHKIRCYAIVIQFLDSLHDFPRIRNKTSQATTRRRLDHQLESAPLVKDIQQSTQQHMV
jgi:hypothetical protein